MKKLLVAVLLLVPLGAACGALTPYAAIVNGERLSEREVDRELQAIRDNELYRRQIEASRNVVGAGSGTFDSAFVAQVLTRHIYFELVHQEVERRKLRIGDKETDAARALVVHRLKDRKVYEAFPEAYRSQLVRREAEVRALDQALGGPSGNDAELKAYFDSHQTEFQRACVSHILVPTREKADELNRRLEAGEDFAEVAKAESQDPGSAPKGGDLGCFGGGAELVPEFKAAAFSRPPGQVGEPVQTQFGFHLVKVNSRIAPPFEEAREQVRSRLLDAPSPPLNEWLQKALGTAEVKLNPKFGRFSKEGGAPAVIPPQAPSQGGNETSPGGPPGGQTTPGGQPVPGGQPNAPTAPGAGGPPGGR